MITIGTDVEVFLCDGEGFVSAHTHLPGTKETPFVIDGGAVQVDGVAAELNTIPAQTFEDFESSLQKVTDGMCSLVPSLSILSETTVPVDLDSLPASAKRLSCMSDINPYVEDVNPSLDEDAPYRSAGGHIHIGGIFTESMTTMEMYKLGCRLARLMDKYVGVYSLLWDKDDYRRGTYGKAGSFRLKEYGIEYRALSNAWFFNTDVRKFVFEATLRAVEALGNGEDGEEAYRDIINTCDHDNKFFWWDSDAAQLEATQCN